MFYPNALCPVFTSCEGSTEAESLGEGRWENDHENFALTSSVTLCSVFLCDTHLWLGSGLTVVGSGSLPQGALKRPWVERALQAASSALSLFI